MWVLLKLIWGRALSYGIKGLEINKPELEIKLVFKFDMQQEGKKQQMWAMTQLWNRCCPSR